MANYNLTGQKIKNTYGQIAQVNDSNKLVDGLGNEKQIVTASIQNFDTAVTDALPSGLVSSSAQVDLSEATGTAQNADTASKAQSFLVGQDTGGTPRTVGFTDSTGGYDSLRLDPKFTYTPNTHTLSVTASQAVSASYAPSSLPDGLVSGSSQIDLSQATGTAANATSASYAVSASHLIGGAGSDAGLVAGTGTDSMRSSDDLGGLPADASGLNSIAIGGAALASNDDTVALGRDVEATGSRAVAIGSVSTAYGDDSVVIGKGSTDSGYNEVVAIGLNNDANQRRSVLIGLDNTSNGDSAIVLGNSNTSNGNNGIVLGVGSSATTDGITIGGGGANSSQYGVTIGNGAAGGGEGAVVIGRNGAGDFDGAVAIGNGTTAQAQNAIVIGNGKSVRVQERNNEINIGDIFQYDGSTSISLKGYVDVNDGGALVLSDWTGSLHDSSILISQTNNATDRVNIGGQNNIQIGHNSRIVESSTRDQVVLIGADAEAAQNTVVIGYSARSLTDAGIAIGKDAEANDNYSVTIGADSTVNANSAIAIGYNLTVSNNNAISIGGTWTYDGSERTTIDSVMNLTSQDPLPTGQVGDLAVSASALYFHNGTSWGVIS